MTEFYFKFQFRNVEYSSGRNKTLLCFRVDTEGGNTEPLKGYMEDEHATAHAEEAFFQQVMHSLSCSPYHFTRMSTPICDGLESVLSRMTSPSRCASQVLPDSTSTREYDVTWYVSSSPCAACAVKLANILCQRKKLRLCIFCSRLFEWEQPEIVEGLRALASAGCKLRMMKPCDFLHVWETYVEKEDQSFAPWEDCQESYNYYMEKLAEILK